MGGGGVRPPPPPPARGAPPPPPFPHRLCPPFLELLSFGAFKKTIHYFFEILYC